MPYIWILIEHSKSVGLNWQLIFLKYYTDIILSGPLQSVGDAMWYVIY